MSAHGFDEPWLTLHARAEGVIEYTLPAVRAVQKPFDLFDPERKSRRQALCPPRVHHRRRRRAAAAPICASCAASSTARICRSTSAARCCSRTRWWREIRQRRHQARAVRARARRPRTTPAEYAKFWDNFGAVLKEGLYEDREQRDTLLGARALPLDRRATDWVASTSMSAAMRPGQDAIYTITGDNREALSTQPAARRASRPRRRGAAADRPDRRVLGRPRSARTRTSRSSRRPAAAPISTRSRPPTTRRKPKTKPRAAGEARQPGRALQAGAAATRSRTCASSRAPDRQRRSASSPTRATSTCISNGC